LFVAILLHELGHCFAARWMEGEANEVLLWPLGGLARVDVPHTPRANFITAAAGPAVNLGLCVLCTLALAFLFADKHYSPAWNPLAWLRPEPGISFPWRHNTAGDVMLYRWGHDPELTGQVGAILLSRFFLVNWFLFLLNVLLVG